MIEVFITTGAEVPGFRVRMRYEKWGCIMGDFRDEVAALGMAAMLDSCTPRDAIRLADLAMKFRAMLYNDPVLDPR